MNSIESLTEKITSFRDERNWQQFHNSKDLSLALSIEVAELNELFLWKNADDVDVEKLKEELADVLIYSIKKITKERKINQKISFPQNLNMEEYCMNINKDKLHYQLFGICIHSGGLHGGHYYAMCKNFQTNEWNKHNDTSVSSTVIQDVLNENPYCLFYVRR